MNPLLRQLLTSAARAAVIWVGARFGSTVSNDDAMQIVVEYLAPAAMLAWGLWQKYRSQQKLNTALASGKPQSEKQVELQIATGGAASVMASKHEVPG